MVVTVWVAVLVRVVQAPLVPQSTTVVGTTVVKVVVTVSTSVTVPLALGMLAAAARAGRAKPT